ncbi:MAG: helix-turn-helix domain-containing protein [Bacteroidales bacterium]|jgi:AraC-like DNA-binding protein|nr:helix-turn-helix domain-containing protein [Bacteroidales bacterium]
MRYTAKLKNRTEFFSEKDNFIHYNNDEILFSEAIYSETINLLFADRLPYRSDYLKILIIRKGVLEIQLDYENHSLEENSCMIALPAHTIQKLHASDDFEAAYIAVSRSFIEEVLMIINHSMYNTRYIQLHQKPFYRLTESELALLMKCVSDIKEKLCLQNHRNQHNLIKCVVLMFLMETENIVIEDIESLQPKQTRYEQIYYQFLQLLIKHCTAQHKVEFYSDMLFITPQHLASILKEISGKTTYQWIIEAILTEVKILLKDSDLTILQIADQLNFQDASLFGKFFKTQTGLSPSQFKKSYKAARG